MFRFVFIRILLSAAVLTLVFATNVFAGEKSKINFTPMVGYHFIDSDLDLEDSVSFGLGVGYGLSDKWGIEAGFRLTPADADSVDSSDRDILSLSMGAQYHLVPESAWNPYLSFGLGLMQFDSDNTRHDDEDVFGYYGGGVKYAITDSTALRLDLSHLMNYASDNRGTLKKDSKFMHQVQAMFGLTFQFGGVTEPASQMAMVEEPVAKPMASSDDDQDGVMDDQDSCPGTAPGVRVDHTGCPADTDGDGVADYLDACVDTPAGSDVDQHGCPAIAKEIDSLTLNILFGMDKCEVTPFHKPELNKAAEFINKYPMYKVVVEGHTDSLGSEEYNKSLSQRRAEGVRNALVKKYGFSADKVSATGLGESQPIADNSNEAGRAQNRRVEISIRP